MLYCHCNSGLLQMQLRSYTHDYFKCHVIAFLALQSLFTELSVGLLKNACSNQMNGYFKTFLCRILFDTHSSKYLINHILREQRGIHAPYGKPFRPFPSKLTHDDRHGRVCGEDEGHVGGDAAAADPDVGAGHLAAAAAPSEHRAVVDADKHLGR